MVKGGACVRECAMDMDVSQESDENLREGMNTQGDAARRSEDDGGNLPSGQLVISSVVVAEDHGLCPPADLLSLQTTTEQCISDGDANHGVVCGSNSSEEKFAQTSENRKPFQEESEESELSTNEKVENIAGDGSVLSFEQLSEPQNPQSVEDSGTVAMADELIELVSNKSDSPSQDSEINVSSSLHAAESNEQDLAVKGRDDSPEKDSSFLFSQSQEQAAKALIFVKDSLDAALNQSVVGEGDAGEGCHVEGMNCIRVTDAAVFSDSFAAAVDVGDDANALTGCKEVVTNIIISSEEQEGALGEKGGFLMHGSCDIRSDLKEQSSNLSVAIAEDDGCELRSLEDSHEELVLGFSKVLQEKQAKEQAQGFSEVLQEKQATNAALAEKASDYNLARSVSLEKVKTELELEMDLFEAAEREEKNKLTSSCRSQEQGESSLLKGGLQVSEASKSERKRVLDDTVVDVSRTVPKKRGRKMHRVSLRKEEDDVCFVCFDGGELVLCDRRSCPKAYHLSCIGRDAAFFEKKGSWFCGWHFCCGCCRAANLQCYTCPKAYCAGCSKEADFFLIRKRKGLCDDCFPIVKMIESGETVNADGVQVDFDDPDTYECLFKEYWEDMKSKFSLKLPKIGRDGKAVESASEVVMEDNSDTDEQSQTEISSGESDGEFDILDDGGKKTKEKRSASRLVNEEHMDHYDWTPQSHEANASGGLGKDSEQLLPREFDGWASKDLLEFLEFMNHDVKTSLSRFQVNKLLWSYIKSNKLQNQQKRTIIECDERLQKLFGKKSMHQFEMMKDIHLHFPPKGASAKAASVSRRRASSTQAIQKDSQRDVQPTVDAIQEKLVESTPKFKRKHESSEVNKVDSNEYAAIIPQNISLIYLRRALLEDLLDDPEFENKVAGTFVRIRVPGTGSKTEMCYRLVQVAGTKLQSQEYKAGKKTTKTVLEIMNLNKKEELTVDLVSNQDFTAEECHRLRQSVKCHFIKALTVGDIEQKALALREAKLHDWFETEALRLSALRDRANEKGRKKELRECVEKLQKLGDLDFRAKKLRNRPIVITDPHMDPDYESEGEEDLNNDGGKPLARGEKISSPDDMDTSSIRSREGKAQAVPAWDRRNVDVTGPNVREWDSLKSHSAGWESRKTRDQSGGYNGDNPWNHMQALNSYKVEPSTWDASKIGGKWGQTNEQEQGAAVDDNNEMRNTPGNWNNQEAWKESETWMTGGNTLHNFGGYGKMDNSGWNSRNAVTDCLVVPSSQQWPVDNPLIPSIPTPPDSRFPAQMPGVVNIPTAETSEKEKVWHYQDPSGTIQGPFAMEQLRKWNATGLFPVSLRIWKYNQPREESILLTDALAGRFAVNQAPWVPQAGTHGTTPYDSNVKGTMTSFRMNERETVSGPVVQRYGDGRRENDSNSMAEFGMETEKGNAWGRGVVPNPWAANQRRENDSNSIPEFGMETEKGNAWGRGVVPNQWEENQRRENHSNSMAEFGMETEKGNAWGRGVVPNPWAANQRQETDSNSMPEFGMETEKGNGWGRVVVPNPWAEFGMETEKGNSWGSSVVPNPWAANQRRENDSNNIAEFGTETEKGSAWGRGVVPNQWGPNQRRENDSNNAWGRGVAPNQWGVANQRRENDSNNAWGRGVAPNQWGVANQRRENDSNSKAEFGMETEKGNAWGRGVPPNQWVTNQRRENDSNSMAEFGMETEKGNAWGRDAVPNQWAANQRRENGSNSMPEFGMETEKVNAWGRGLSPNQRAANQRPWGPMPNQGSQNLMPNQGLGSGRGRGNWNETGHGPSAFGRSPQIEQKGHIKVLPCRYHQKGFCRKGDMCLFRHD